ncbi:MAG TPA: hypothetical protein PK313_09445 [Myxococcota bacterium]|nr:hypothetical protein [Myxococcota bacterium]
MNGADGRASERTADGGEGQGPSARLWTRRGLLGAGVLAMLGWWAGAAGGSAGSAAGGPRIRVVALRRAALYAAHDRAG